MRHQLRQHEAPVVHASQAAGTAGVSREEPVKEAPHGSLGTPESPQQRSHGALKGWNSNIDSALKKSQAQKPDLPGALGPKH